MIKEPENIENRVRNTLGPLQTLHNICQMMVGEDADSKNSVKLFEHLVNSDLIKNAQKSIDKLILLARASDKKLADPTFNIEEYIETNNITL